MQVETAASAERDNAQSRRGNRAPRSIEWANSFAEQAPSIMGPLPGPNSLRLFERCARHDLSPFPWVEPVPVGYASGIGVTIDDVDGNRFLDLTHGHTSTGFGHGNPEVAEAIAAQAHSLMNIRNYPHELRMQLMERLSRITPEDLNLFGLYSSGTEATEAAMRVARSVTGGFEFLSFYGDYHGKTAGSIATSDTADMSSGPRAAGHTIVPAGWCRRCEFKLEPSTCGLHCVDFAERAMLAHSQGKLAGIIIEPISNGSGARVYAPGFLKGLRDMADRHGIPLIFDEHATGLGRTGSWFAGDQEGVVPDILIFAKTLGNGYPIVAVAAREGYRQAAARTSHSSTHGGMPAGCAAALAVLDIIERDDIIGHVRVTGADLLAEMQRMADRHPIVGAASGRGFLLGFEIVDPVTGEPSARIAQQVGNAFLRNGLSTAPAYTVVRISPMLVTSRETALRALAICDKALSEVEEALS